MATLRGFATGRPVVVLSVLDDGAGFDPSASYAGHFGLGTIRERATAVDGRIAIDSAPGGRDDGDVVLPTAAEPGSTLGARSA
jgi:nitrate/nitrite-specific signal transduction histidine kinase